MNQAYLQQFSQCIRFSHIQDDVLQAALIDLNDPYRCGNVYLGQVIHVAASIAWIDIGASKPALLKCRNQQFHHGMRLVVRITRESQYNAYENKGPQVVMDPRFISDNPLSPGLPNAPYLLKSAQPTWLNYIQSLDTTSALPLTIYINDINLFNTAQSHVNLPHIKLILKQSDPLPESIDHDWQDLLGSMHHLESGGHLLLEETKACSVFDLNTSGLNNNDAVKSLTTIDERLKFNCTAIAQILRLIDLRELSGTLFIDFLRLNNWQLQQKLLINLRHQAKKIKDLRILGFTPGGWIEACRTVKGPSLKAKAVYLAKDAMHDQIVKF